MKEWILETDNLLLIGLTGVMKCKYFDQINTVAGVLPEVDCVKNRLESGSHSKQYLCGTGTWKETLLRKVYEINEKKTQFDVQQFWATKSPVKQKIFFSEKKTCSFFC